MTKLQKQYEDETGVSYNDYGCTKFYSEKYIKWLERKVLTKKCDDCCEDWQNN
jgi:hypothetical protein